MSAHLKKCKHCDQEAEADVVYCSWCGNRFDGGERAYDPAAAKTSGASTTGETTGPGQPSADWPAVPQGASLSDVFDAIGLASEPAPAGAGDAASQTSDASFSGTHGGLQYFDIGIAGEEEQRLDLEVSQAGSSEAVDRSPICGRSEEMVALNDVFTQVLTGASQLCLVLGDEGAGKTRMLAEAAALAREKGFVAVGAHAARFGVPLAGDVFRQWVIGLCDVLSGGQRPQDALQLSPIEEAVTWPGEQLPSALGQRLVQLFAGSLAEPVSSAGEHAQRMEAALFYFLWIVAQSRPLCLLVDDAELVDRDSLRLLNALTKRLPDSQLVAIAAGTPALAGLFPEGATQIALTALSDRDTLVLAANCMEVGAPPEGVEAALQAGLRGNPLLIKHQMRRLMEERVLSLVGGSWQLGEIERKHLATQPKDFTVQRATDLSSGALYTLRVAALAGTLISPEVLHGVCAARGIDVKEELLEVVNHGLITPAGRITGLHSFFQACTRTHLLEGLSDDVLRATHPALAAAYERSKQVPRDMALELMGQHLFVAGGSERAAPYLRAVGRKLYNQGLHGAAQDYFRLAVRLGLHHRKDLELGIESVAKALYGLGDVATAQLAVEDPGRAAELVLPILEALPPNIAPVERARAASRRGLALQAAGKGRAAVAALDKAVKEYPPSADAAQRAMLLADQGRVHQNSGQWNEAADLYTKALTALSAIQSVDPDADRERSDVIAVTFCRLSAIYSNLDRDDLAQQAAENALQVARNSAQPWAQVRALVQLAVVAQERKRPDLAGPLYEESQAIAEQALDPWLMAEVYFERYRLLIRTDRQLAADLLQRAFHSARMSGRRSIQEAAKASLQALGL